VLNDHERKTLREVEHQLMADDPEFTRAFEARQARLPRRPRRGTGIAVVAGILLAALMLIAGSLTGALAVAVTTWLIWMAYRRAAGLGRRPQETTGE
jgi:fatty acid desaturase